MSVLWFAAFKRVTIGFRKRTGEYPFAIRDRTQSTGISIEGEGRYFYQVAPQELASIAEQAYAADVDVPRSILLSMEFFAAAGLEATGRAQFISLMTALEALAEQRDYGDEIGGIFVDLAQQLESDPLLQEPDNKPLRASLSGRIRQLRKESVRQAILRTVREHVDDPEAMKFIDHAYDLRSKMLHEGYQIRELPELSSGLRNILIQMYSSVLKLPLKPSNPLET
jgi:hypothetical protein